MRSVIQKKEKGVGSRAGKVAGFKSTALHLLNVSLEHKEKIFAARLEYREVKLTV